MSETAAVEATTATEAPPTAPLSDDGGSFLSSIASNDPPAVPAPEPGTADEAIANAVAAGDRPEYIPEKFWDAENKQAKVEELGKGYVNLEKLMSSQNRIEIPNGDDDEEGWERLNAALRPEEPDDYDFGERPELPEGLPYDEETEKSFRTWCHQNGVPQRSAKGLFDGFVKRQIEAHGSFAKARMEERTQLQHAMQREYGDGYAAAVTRAHNTMSKYGDPDFVKYLNDTGLGNDPRMIRFAERIGKDMNGETRLQGGPAEGETAVDLDTAIAEFNSKHEKALFDPLHHDHKRLVAERSKLYEKRYGNAEVIVGR